MGASSILFCVESTMTNGWPDALVEHYRAERLPLVRVAALVLGSKELAEEAVQDAVVAVRAHWDRVDDPPTYLRTAVLNRAREIARRHHPAEAVSVERDLPEDLIDLRRALLRLPLRQREVLVLRHVVGLTDDEIAGHLSCTRSTIRSLAARAVRALRKDLLS
jgi:RNA polymerase sigma factor (sigma-70 family)